MRWHDRDTSVLFTQALTSFYCLCQSSRHDCYILSRQQAKEAD